MSGVSAPLASDERRSGSAPAKRADQLEATAVHAHYNRSKLLVFGGARGTGHRARADIKCDLTAISPRFI